MRKNFDMKRNNNRTQQSLKKRLNALKPLDKSKEPPQWCNEYVTSITVERWKTISEALKLYKHGQTVNP